jgi:polar amino acid transport system permease protein
MGVVVALGRLSQSRLLSLISGGAVWAFRSIPLLVLILVFGNIALFLPRIELAVPFTDVVLFSVQTSTIVTPFVAALIALSLHEGAYYAEIVRAGLISVDVG